MTNQGNSTEKAGQLASKAAHLGGQAKDKATEVAGGMVNRAKPLAGQAKDKASGVAGDMVNRAKPIAGQAKDKATDLAHKAGPIAAHGVEVTAQKLDELTKGRYHDRIVSLSNSLEHLLDPSHNGATQAGSPTADTPTAGPTADAPTAGPAATGAAEPITPAPPPSAEKPATSQEN
jgi:hypothetical protein